MSSVISRIMIAPVLISSLLVASDKPTTVLAKHLYANTQNHTVLHDKDGFSVNGKRVSDADVSKDLRGISGGALRKLFAKDKTALQVSRIGNDYRIDGRNRLNGGGPNFGYFMYWATKTVCYGIIGGGFAAGGMAVATVAAPVLGVTVAGAVGGAVGTVGASTVPSAIVIGSATTAVGIATAVAPIGAIATVVAADAGLATAAVLGTAQVASATAATGGVVAAVEGFSLFMGALCGMAPTP